MKMLGNELSVLVRKISWISMGVVGFGVAVSAVLLAIDAPPGAPPEAVAKQSSRYKSRAPKSRYMAPLRSKPTLPKMPISKGARPPTGVEQPAVARTPRPELLRGKMKGLSQVMRPALTGRAKPGRLSKEELKTRREDRRVRQVERLGKRIQTLQDRIENYKKDGSRTEAQISRMERSLDRMRKRLKRMQEQKEP